MLLIKMQKACKKSKAIQLVKYGSQTFLTNGYVAAYISAEAPGWNENDIAISIGLNEDQRNNYIKGRDFMERASIDIGDMTPAFKMDYSIKRGKTTLIPFMTDYGKVFFVDADRLELFDDYESDAFFIGDIGAVMDPVLVVIAGNTPIGIIVPERLNLSQMKSFAASFLTGIKLSEAEGFFDAGGQMEIEEPPEAESECSDVGKDSI